MLTSARNLNMLKQVTYASESSHFTLSKPELRFCAGSNPARGVAEIRNGEDL